MSIQEILGIIGIIILACMLYYATIRNTDEFKTI